MQNGEVVGLGDANELAVVDFGAHHALVVELVHRRRDTETGETETDKHTITNIIQEQRLGKTLKTFTIKTYKKFGNVVEYHPVGSSPIKSSSKKKRNPVKLGKNPGPKKIDKKRKRSKKAKKKKEKEEDWEAGEEKDEEKEEEEDE